MAKGNIALGKFRGKVGGQVLRVDAGIGQIISEYNAHPSNPRTVAQTKQRSKMNLAGQVSKITPYAAIAGLDSNRRKARSIFVSKLLKKATVDDSTHITSSLIRDMVLSTGLTIPVTTTITGTGDQGTVTVAGTISVAEFPVLGAIMAVYMAHENGEVLCITRKITSATINETINVPTSWTEADLPYDVEVFIVPIIDKGTEATVAFEALTIAGDQFSAGYARTLASAGAYAASVYAGYYNYAG